MATDESDSIPYLAGARSLRLLFFQVSDLVLYALLFVNSLMDLNYHVGAFALSIHALNVSLFQKKKHALNHLI